MSKLYQTKLDVQCVDMGKESSIPMLSGLHTREDVLPSNLPEDEGLFLKYQFVRTAFPYCAQDNYTRSYNGEKLDVIVLENENLRASFAPGMGGKLWSLYDKKKQRELLFSNPVARPAHLGTRNAWCSGGVEWNCGIWGHTPFTCSPIFVARLADDRGEPVLRMYEYERIRGVVYQMDFSLPEGSEVLYARMRVVNPSQHSTAMYWWSNIAVPAMEGSRVIVPADAAYSIVDGAMTLVPIPKRDGIDVTYPNHNPVSVDYFFKTKADHRKYICHMLPDGYGLFECSTARLQGRKIFVWGQGPGGRKWQEYLSGEGNPGLYNEIQCGLARTQSECLPMPPQTAWEWLEAYGPIEADMHQINGEWLEARGAVEDRIDRIISAEALEERLIATRELAHRPADEMLWKGSGWGALENLRRSKVGQPCMCPHLDFGDTSCPQAAWVSLLYTGTMGEHDGAVAPISWMRQQEWTRMLEDATEHEDRENWYTLLQLGCDCLARLELAKGETLINRSLTCKWTAWGVYALAEVRRLRGEEHRAAMMMVEAANLAPNDPNLAKAAARALHQTGNYKTQICFADSRSETISRLPRLRLYLAFALAQLGQIDEAESILHENNVWLEVPDTQEGETSLSDLWYQIQAVRAERAGASFDPTQASPPHELDFRMFAVK